MSLSRALTFPTMIPVLEFERADKVLYLLLLRTYLLYGYKLRDPNTAVPCVLAASLFIEYINLPKHVSGFLELIILMRGHIKSEGWSPPACFERKISNSSTGPKLY